MLHLSFSCILTSYYIPSVAILDTVGSLLFHVNPVRFVKFAYCGVSHGVSSVVGAVGGIFTKKVVEVVVEAPVDYTLSFFVVLAVIIAFTFNAMKK